MPYPRLVRGFCAPARLRPHHFTVVGWWDHDRELDLRQSERERDDLAFTTGGASGGARLRVVVEQFV